MASNPHLPKTNTKEELVNAHRKAVFKQITDRKTMIDFDEYSKLKQRVALNIFDPYEEYLEIQE